MPTGMGQKAQHRRREETQTASELFYKASMNLIFYIDIKLYIIHICVYVCAYTHKESYIIKAYDAPHKNHRLTETTELSTRNCL